MRTVQIPRRFVRSSWGGTETVILETCRQMLRKGHATEIVCSAALSETRRERIGGVSVTRLPYFYPYLGLGGEARAQLDNKGGNLFSLQMFGELRRRRGVDLIHLHTGKRFGGIARHVARQKDIPYIVSLHGGVHDVPAAEAASWTAPTDGALEWGKLLGLWVGSRRVLHDAEAIFCVGKKEWELTCERFPGRRVVLLPNGVDVDRFARGDGAAFREARGIPRDAEVLLTVGRIDPQKNQLLALELLERMLPQHPRLHLLMVGHVTDEGYAAQLDARIADRGLGAHVTLVRGIEASSQELVDAFHAADVFLLPSIHEPFGIVLLEAWAAGLPVVASQVGGAAALVEQGAGLLFRSGDVEMAAGAVGHLLTSESLRRELGREGRTCAVERYSWSRITEQVLAEYEFAIERHRHRRKRA